jgi:tRNA(Ile)-lysidine synthase
MQLPRTLQDLPPAVAHLFLQVERFIAGEKGEAGPRLDRSSLLVAFSGGADSTALLLFCTVMSGRWGAQVRAAHLDHMLRPESGTEAGLAAEVCRRLGVELTVERVDVPALCGQSLTGAEEKAREIRYGFLERTRRVHGADLILTGHHADDLAEDVVMRLARGAGWPGLAGMKAWDPERRLLRPFLTTPKAELTGLLGMLGVAWTEDGSNQDLRPWRNRVRHLLLPLLKEQNPAVCQAISQLWKLGRIEESYWENALSWVPRPLPGAHEVLLEADSLSVRLRAERLRAYKRCLDSLGPGQALFENLLGLDRAFAAGRHGTFQFPGSKKATVLAEGIRFWAELQSPDQKTP